MLVDKPRIHVVDQPQIHPRGSVANLAPPRFAQGLLKLIEGALARVLVLAPAPQLGAVADAPGGDVVEVDLDHQLGAQRDPLEVAPRAPAAGVGGAALPRLVGREEADEAALLGGGESRSSGRRRADASPS